MTSHRPTLSIVSTPGVCGGKPRLDTTDITVSIVVSLFLAGQSIRWIAHKYDLSVVTVEGALRFHLRAQRDA